MVSKTLRQRRSKSPVRSRHNGDPEAPQQQGSLSAAYINGTGNGNGNVTGKYNHSKNIPLAFQVALAIAATILALVGYWLSIFSGIHNTDPTCPISKFDYPWCANKIMHKGEVPDPLTSEEWLDLRKKYQQAVAQGGTPTKISLANGWDEPDHFGFQIMDSIEIRNSPGMGRGIFATNEIPKGTKIWDNRYRAVFPNDCTAKHFFAELNNQQACDAMFWGYTNNFYGNGIQYMFDLDGHGYINHADEITANAVHHFENEMDTATYSVARTLPWGGSLANDPARWEARNRPGAYGLYAERDIQAGEELFYDYGEIYMTGLFDWYSLFVSRSLPLWEWHTI